MRIRLRAKDITTLPDIALIRHSISQPVPGVSAHTWELTDLGVQRCAALADALRPYALSRLATSDEPKAVTTAETLHTHLNIAAPLIIEPAFGKHAGSPQHTSTISACFAAPFERR
ncbi:MAG: hypothetical protein UZ13_00801 [Chloroflexi bacterium OLB13]|nr:MAG: hypothetical protein UZ13_00801 [Chloroflexi bacterium OLB13]